MRSPISHAVALLDRIQRRFARSRAGSVLILTVVLIVLLALMGTALLSTTRTDRFISTQNAVNTQIDMLVEGVMALARSAIYDDMYGTLPDGTTKAYRPEIDLSAGANASTYDHWDFPYLKNDPVSTAIDKQNDIWLASPVPAVEENPGSPPTATTPITWPATTMLPDVTFETPMVVNNNGTVVTNISHVYTQHARMQPMFAAPAHMANKVPAWHAGGSNYYLAADADGDGIADSSFFKLPVGQIDGVTYYAAVRIVDNSSKININTALSQAYEFTTHSPSGVGGAGFSDALGNGPAAGRFAENLGWFRSHIGLYEMLHRTGGASFAPVTAMPGTWMNGYAFAELSAINRYRFGYPTQNNSPSAPFFPTDTWVEDPDIYPRTNLGVGTRNDGTFVTAGDAMEHQLARRLFNPGYAQFSAGFVPYRAFSLSDTLALAYHGGAQINLDASPSLLEQTFFDAWRISGSGATATNSRDSIYRSAPNYNVPVGTPRSIPGYKSYPADYVFNWYDEVFNFSGAQNGVPATGFLTPTLPGKTILNDRLTYQRPIRSLLTTFNPVSNLIQKRERGPGALAGGMPPYRSNAPKTNINTAALVELYRAFWSVMAEDTGKSGSPFGINQVPGDRIYQGQEFENDIITSPIDTPAKDLGNHEARMFRSPLRDPRATTTLNAVLPTNSVVHLRAMIAAANAISLRDNTALAYDFTLPGFYEGVQDTEMKVRVYGYRAQPFITEVFGSSDTQSEGPTAGTKNNTGYIAVELYNPYPFDIDMSNARLAFIRRPQTGSYPLAMTEITANFTGKTIDANGYMLIENFAPSGGTNAATYRPPSSHMPAETPAASIERTGSPSALTVVTAPDLGLAWDNELVILDRETGGAAISPIGDDLNLRPIDSFDFTGFTPSTDQSGSYAYLVHYVRANDASHKWQFVYPGRYMAAEDAFQRRQQGTRMRAYLPIDGETDPWDPMNPMGPQPPTGQEPSFGYNAAGTPTTNENSFASYDQLFPIPLDVFSGTPAPSQGLYPVAASGNRFPFGGFARNGDILQVPFIGAYRVWREPSPGTVELIELNSITMDAVFAEDTDLADDPQAGGTPALADRNLEHIGRFCPISEFTSGGSTVNDFSNDTSTHRYAWARKLFDYLTVQSPADDYLPNVRPERYTAVGGPDPQPTDNDGDGTGAVQDNSPNPPPVPPPGYPASAVGVEDTQAVHGLININTAPWRVLAALPILPAGDNYTYTAGSGSWSGSANGIDDNAELAKAIVLWRDGGLNLGAAPSPPSNGPFRSIMDLYAVPAFRGAQNLITGTGSTEPDDAQGDFTPHDNPPSGVIPSPTYDGVRNDYEEKFLLFNRISNLITTRSDSFTVYILVQGWRGVGTLKPEMVVQRRVAFLQDRSGAGEDKPLPAAVNIPND